MVSPERLYLKACDWLRASRIRGMKSQEAVVSSPELLTCSLLHFTIGSAGVACAADRIMCWHGVGWYLADVCGLHSHAVRSNGNGMPRGQG